MLREKINQFKERCLFAEYCFPKGDDKRFVDYVREYGKNPSLVSLEKKDENSKSEIFYHIYMEESKSGFFADHNRLLAYLYFADFYGMIPVIEYTEKYCYAERHPIHGTSNPFEYYFVQPAGKSTEELGGVCVRSRKENTFLANQLNEKGNGYSRSEQYLKEMGRISRKYIRLCAESEAYIYEGIKKILSGRKVLGVHVRGTDFKRNYNGHPIVVTGQEYCDAARKLMDEGKYDKLFLATDDLGALELFQKEFKEQLCFYEDVVRSSGNETVMKSEIQRKDHHYHLGLEVLRDMYTLSECAGLIAGLSQVSYAARITKISRNEEYADLLILNKGINYHKMNNCK